MARTVKVATPQGTIEGEEVDFKALSEPWASLELEDGYSVRLKVVVTQVIRTKQRDPDGNPLYIVRSSNVMAVSPPEAPRRGEIH